MAANDVILGYEQWGLSALTGQADPCVYEQWLLITTGIQPAPYATVQEQWVVQAGTGSAGVQALGHEQWVVLVATDQVPTTPVSAWIYPFDGHLFYGLNLDTQGTTVLDVTTGQWSDWRTGDLPWLNMNLTVMWRAETHGASLLAPSILRFDPSSTMDDGWRTNTFVASGRQELQDRAYVGVAEALVFGSIGLRGGDVRLRYSNNDGESWSVPVTRTVLPGSRATSVIYRDLGSARAPGRIWEIEDNGTMRRIGALVARLDNGG